jgi:hypothetical protein
LWCTLWQCHRRNPTADVVLIGDRDPHLPFVRFVPISRYDAAAARFRDVYVHASTNPVEFERFCFERWFLLDALVKEQGWTRFVHADSDLMFYAEIERYFERLGDSAMASGRVGASSGHHLMVQKVIGLSDFCQFMLDMYVKPELFMEFYRIYRWHRSTGAPGGLCDMSALTAFVEKGLVTHYELNRIVDRTIFDQALTNPWLSDRTEMCPMTQTG